MQERTHNIYICLISNQLLPKYKNLDEVGLN